MCHKVIEALVCGCICPLSRRPWSVSWRAGVCPSCRIWKVASQGTPAVPGCGAPPPWPRAWRRQMGPAWPCRLRARRSAPEARSPTAALFSWTPARGRPVWQREAQPTTTLWFMWRAPQVIPQQTQQAQRSRFKTPRTVSRQQSEHQTIFKETVLQLSDKC